MYHTYGISYTWSFLFKCHVSQKPKPKPLTKSFPYGEAKLDVELDEGLFGCIFCCATGGGGDWNGTPVFRGPEALSWHLRSHADDSIKDHELCTRIKLVIGRELRQGETFDLHIPRLDRGNGTGISSVSVALDGDGRWEMAQTDFGSERYARSSTTTNRTDGAERGLSIAEDRTPPAAPAPSLTGEGTSDVHQGHRWDITDLKKIESGSSQTTSNQGSEVRMWVKQAAFVPMAA